MSGPTPRDPTGTPRLTRSPRPSLTSSSTTLIGTITEGVESGCLLLSGYLLVGGPRDVLTTGQAVRVTGHEEPRLQTTCQQGIPFVVETAELVTS
jgi:hypothetical protein